MEIKDLRKKTHMSQEQFSKYFNIPIGTLRNWEQGIRRPPDYVLGMIQKILKCDGLL